MGINRMGKTQPESNEASPEEPQGYEQIPAVRRSKILTEEQRNVIHDLMIASGVSIVHCVNILRENNWNYKLSLQKALARNPQCPKCNKYMKGFITRTMDASNYHCEEHGSWTLWWRTGELTQK